MFFCLIWGRKTYNTVMENLIQCYTRWTLLFLLIDEINTTQLTITPQQITVGGQNPTLYLNGTCTPNAPGITTLFNIEIGRRSSGIDNPIVQIQTGANSPTIKHSSLQSRLTVSGSINGASGSLQFSLRDPTCSDVDSTFYCKTVYNTASGAGNDETTGNITARSYPGTIRTISSPDRDQYNPPVLVQFTCTGLIGNTFPSNQANFWRWQWRIVGDINTQWTTYPYSANITYRTPTSSGSCNYNGGSTLTHTVTDLDNGRQFRCSVLNDQYSDSKTVHTQAPSDFGTKLGVGIAIGIGIMLVVIIIFLIFVFIFRMQVAACLTGGRNKGGKVPDSGMSFQDLSGGNAQTSQIHATETSNLSIPTNDYQVLDANTRDVKTSNTYEQIHEYQNS